MKVVWFAELGKILSRIACALERQADSLEDIRVLLVRAEKYQEEKASDEVVVHLDRRKASRGKAR